MTVIHLQFTRPAADGTLLPAGGSLTWTPSNSHAIPGSPDNVVVPAGFEVPLGSVPADLTVAATGPSWCWRIDEKIYGTPPRTIYVVVPDVAEVDYPDLVQVDPATLVPLANPEPAWWAALENGLVSAQPGPPNVLTMGAVTTGAAGTSASATITGSAPAQTLGLTIPRGDPGGIVLGTLLNTTDLNTLTTSGVYRQDNGANITLAKNYPENSGETGVLIVHQVNASFIEQQWHPSDAIRHSRVFWTRSYNYGAWRAWRAYPSSRVDQTAGRVIYQWDPVNSREQLVYGDTGWRNINADIPERSAGNVFIRRRGGAVDFVFEGFAVTGQTAAMAINLPYLGNSILTGTLPIGTGNHSTGFPHTFTYRWNGAHALTFGSTAAASGYASFPSRDSWPSTLPGVAYGTIPNT